MAMRTVVEAVATQSRLRPTAVAVYSVAPGGDAREISYEDLWTAARALAGLLRDRLAERGEEQHVVAVGAVEDAELVVVQLAVLLAGMIYCPVDLADPRCGAVLEDANAQLLVHGTCDSNARTVLNSPSGEVKAMLFLLPSLETLITMTSAGSFPNPQPSDISHIFFTSGSTGRPKGVVVTHESLLAYSQSRAKRSEISGERTGERDGDGDGDGDGDEDRIGTGARVFIASSLTFDPSLGEALTALCSGATVCVARAAHITGGQLAICLQKSRATHVCMTPTLFRLRGNEEALPDFVPTMREVSLGGEPMPESIAQAARTTWPARCRLVNIYGVTEATVYQCLTDVGAMGPGRGGEQVIAAALEGIHVGLMALASEQAASNKDESGVAPTPLTNETESIEWIFPRPAPASASTSTPQHASKRPCPRPRCEHEQSLNNRVQEIVLGGKQVARGYLHQDRLTAERFFSNANAAGLWCFRTGDMGRLEWLPRPPDFEEHRAVVPLPCSCGDFVGPVIRLLGRQDHQIKLRGVRIEIGEIEAHVDRLRAKGGFLEDFALVKHENLDQLVLWIALSASAASRKGIQQWDANQVGALPRCVEEAVRVFLRRHVPTIMIPGRVAAIKSFDHFQSPNGKRDMQRIRSLSVPARGVLASQRVAELSDTSFADASSTESATALTSLEALIASIWSKRLGVNPAVIGPWDSFASIGGDSLEAQRVTHELVSLAGGKDAQIRTTEESFGEFTGAFSVANLLTAPCLRAYASILAQSSEAASLLTGTEVDVNDGCDRNASRPIEDAAQHALFVAVTDGLDDAVRILVDPEFGGLDPDAGVSREQRGKSPLHVAAAAGHAKVVRVLLEAGANIFATTNDKVQAAHIAASAPGPGGTESFRLLLEALRARGVKKPSMVRDGRKQTLLHAAARGGNCDSLALALDVLSEDVGEGGDPVQSRLKIVRCLDRWSRTALHWAVVNDHVECASLLLEHGAEAEPKLREAVKGRRTHLQYESPLQIARRKNASPMIAVLLQSLSTEKNDSLVE